MKTADDSKRSEVVYMRYYGKWGVVSDRDFVIVTACEQINENKIVVGTAPAEDLY